jgi:hypothetical protein
MEICKINPETKQLESVKKYYNTITAPNFNRVRGSSIFIDVGDYLLGVVHFSDDIVPRNYYHMLVALNKTTLCPIKYSQPFCFQHIGIEFCIGFWKQDNNYLFWVSKIDRNPCMIKIDMNEIPNIPNEDLNYRKTKNKVKGLSRIYSYFNAPVVKFLNHQLPKRRKKFM